MIPLASRLYNFPYPPKVTKGLGIMNCLINNPAIATILYTLKHPPFNLPLTLHSLIYYNIIIIACVLYIALR